MIYFVTMVVVAAMVTGLYVTVEIKHYRKGHDVFDWTKKLADWIDGK